MSTANAIQRRNSTQLTEANYDPLEVRVALNQNLWGLPDDQVWQYYRMMCGHLRLDPASKPFDIITDAKQQQKKLYPNTSCTSQLGENARLSYGKLDIDVNQALVALGFKVAHVSLEVRHPSGRTLVSEAFVDLMSGYAERGAPPEPLKGNNLVNALKKAGTQCRRRGTLQMLGLAAPAEQIPTVTLGDLERAEGDVDGVVIEHPPAAALQAQPEPQKTDSGKLTCPRRKLLAEIAVELKAKGISADDLRARTVSLCDGNTDFRKLDDADVEGLIIDFSQWLDLVNANASE